MTALSQQPQSKSFKKLKQLSKKKGKSKGGAGPDPTHQSFLLSLKGIKSTLVDLDIIETEFRTFALAAEESGSIIAYALERVESKPNASQSPVSVFFKSHKLCGGTKITSASFSLAKSAGESSLSLAEERVQPVKFYVAISCFDHVQVKVLQVTYHKQEF